MKHIVSFSGGKDSTAMLLMMLEKGMPVDEIVMFDTGWEFPEMYQHIERVRSFINQSITILKDEKPLYPYWFKDHIKTKGERKGEKGYSWPDFKNRWCTRRKEQVQSKYLNNKYGKGNYIEYQGIAFDEQHRLLKNKTNRVIKFPLVDWEKTEKQAMEYCYERGFNWSGLYEKFDRVSCFCCPLQRIGELKVIYTDYPELWQQMKEMDTSTFRKFRSDYSITDLENKFTAHAGQIKGEKE